ncbi:MAG: FMN-binding glutamate synthase family protein [Gemmatimonadota bacterium]
MIHRIRGYVLPAVLLVAVALGGLGLVWAPAWWGLVLVGPLAGLGIHDVLQRRHALLRNYPILGHLRFLLEDMGPELHQYFVESHTDGRPFDRDRRTLAYTRAKNVADTKPFGTELDVYEEGYVWLAHSIAPKPVPERPWETLRVRVGGPSCSRPYEASILNISAMSFGALGARAILALNAGAKKGGFAHNTGEGGLSRYHRENGGDIIWQIGTGYFGCRTPAGGFDPDRFAKQARLDQVKMIELKLSQGAKPGHGGILPAAKVSEEIAAARGVPPHEDCLSPTWHRAFSTPIELLEFIIRLRELCGGKPVGFKLCVGRPAEFLGICKAMLETGITPDFVTVDGGEGGTGAAPLEFSNHVGMPLVEGLLFVHNALVGIGVRDRLRIAASAKRISGFHIATALSLGADWCNSARGFMFALGCIQAQICHTNRCPVGVTTQNPRLQRALVVEEKAERVYHFHRNTVKALAEIVAAAGLSHPGELRPHHIWERTAAYEVRNFAEIYEFLEPGQLLDGRADGFLKPYWDRADARSFQA